MKKTYLTPAIETTEVLVEQGIAMSTSGSYILDAQEVIYEDEF